MTSEAEPNPPSEPGGGSRGLTPFSIEDILRKPSGERAPSAGHVPSARAPHSSPLCALEELTSKTFKGLEVRALRAAEGQDGVSSSVQRSQKKRRKSRTAFTNHQIMELEKRFLYQKYLSPADRDRISQHLGLSHAQVITWFQNRRAKLRRDLEEMKADMESAKAVGSAVLRTVPRPAELDRSAPGGPAGVRPPPQATRCRAESHPEPPRPPTDPTSPQ